MTPEIKNEPLRLKFSRAERAYIIERLRSANWRRGLWAMVAVITAGAILASAHRSGDVPYDVQVDRIIAETDRGPTESRRAADCRESYHVYVETRRTIGFCDDDPQHAAFRTNLDAADEAQGWWPLVNSLPILVGSLVLLRARIGAVGAFFDISKYRKYADDLRAFLRRYNRTA